MSTDAPSAKPLLATKCFVPAVRPSLVPRRRLIEQLDRALLRKLVLLSAPAGSGKTTLLSEWTAGVGGRTRVAWLSLDEGDSDPVRFLSYVVAALQTVCPDLGAFVGEALRATQPTPIDAVLTVLINEIAGLDEHLSLVLDDYHLVDARSAHGVLAFLLEHQPPNLCLIVASRADLPLPLARMRARGDMAEIRAADLRFTVEEARAFLNRSMGLGLSDEDVVSLGGSTEGWAAGLQMAALAVQARRTAESGRGVSDLAFATPGDEQEWVPHRYILDYLTEEVLDRQTPEVASFSLETSILRRLCGPLCDAVTGRGDGRAVLQQLDAANLFLVPLDGRRHWYRYHHLFADLLRHRLGRDQPGRAPALHLRASRWHEAHSATAEAVYHAVESGDLDRAAEVVEANAFAIIAQGELATVVKWMDYLPGGVVRSRPWLSVAYAWVLLHSGQMEAVEPRLHDAELAMADVEDDLVGTIATIRAYSAASFGEISQGIAFARQATACLSEQQVMVRSFALAMLGSLFRFAGDFAASARSNAQARSISQAAGDRPMAILASCNLAGTLILQGELGRAAATLREVLGCGEDGPADKVPSLPFSGLGCTALATVLREWNELERAEEFARRGVELSENWGQAEVTLQGHVELARVLQGRGDAAGSREALGRARRVAPGLAAWTMVPLEAAEARMYLVQGDLEAASLWAEERQLKTEETPDFQQMFNYLALARVRMAQGRWTEAARLLSRLRDRSEAAGASGCAVEILVLEALVSQALGHEQDALAQLSSALSLAEPEEYVRVFVDEGLPLASLLRKAAAQGTAIQYVSRLLAAIRSTPAVTSSELREEALIEPLSERELEVLRLLAAGLSNRQIAEELTLALGTVKKHINNIYGKLGVERRTQAIGRAGELGLV